MSASDWPALPSDAEIRRMAYRAELMKLRAEIWAGIAAFDRSAAKIDAQMRAWRPPEDEKAKEFVSECPF